MIVKQKKILVIDGNSFFYRCYYATHRMVRTGTLNTNGVYTAIKVLKNFLNKNDQYTKIFITFDFGKKTFRHQIFNEYKGKRKKTPIELIDQLPLFKNFLKIMKITYFENPEYEADDLVASLTKKALQNKIAVDIISNDYDLLQVIQKNVSVIQWKNHQETQQIITLDNIFKVFGLEASQIVDFKILAGDASDNIKGINGIGKKTASKLLQKYGSINNLLKNFETLPLNLKIKFTNQEINIQKLHQIIKIKNDIPLKCDFETQKYDFFTNQAKDFYRKYQMFTMLKKNLNISKRKQKRFFLRFNNK